MYIFVNTHSAASGVFLFYFLNKENRLSFSRFFSLWKFCFFIRAKISRNNIRQELLFRRTARFSLSYKIFSTSLFKFFNEAYWLTSSEKISILPHSDHILFLAVVQRCPKKL